MPFSLVNHAFPAHLQTCVLQVTMIVSEKLAQEEAKLAFALHDNNLQFLTLIEHFPPEKKHNAGSSSLLVAKVTERVAQLDFDEIIEWASVLLLKLKQLLSRAKLIKKCAVFGETLTAKEREVFTAFRQSVRLLVRVCVSFEIEYDGRLTQELIKQFYHSEYGDEALPFFCAANYECCEYRVFPERKVFEMECCKGKSFSMARVR